MNDFLDVAKDAARKAGKVSMRYYSKDLNIKKKSDKSFVSDADLAAEKIILKTILDKYPKHAFYSEEKGKSTNDSEYCWYIDPIDGTHNFIHNIPLFGTSIALAKGDDFILGAIYLPVFDELFYAEKGKGASLNGKRIKVSDKELKDSFMSFTASFYRHTSNIFKLVNIFQKKCREIRIFGSCALQLAYLACGKIDFYIKPGITPYDTGAGKVILEEAGGRLTQLDGSEFVTDSNNFIASNNVFHDKLIEIMKKEWKP